eukprot:scaffold263688_cov35-Attheya_sp.AAC.1
MIIGWWRRDEVGGLSVSTEAGAVSMNESLTNIIGGSAGHDMLWWQMLAMTQQVERRAWLPM